MTDFTVTEGEGIHVWIRLRDCGTCLAEQIISVRIASADFSATLRIATDMCSSGSLERVVVSEAVFDNCLIEHIGNNSSRNALSLIALNTIVHHRAPLDEAVADFAVACKTSSNTTRTTIPLLVIDSHVLHAKSGNRT